MNSDDSSSSMLSPEQKAALQQLLMERMQLSSQPKLSGTLVADNTSDLSDMMRNNLGAGASYRPDDYDRWQSLKTVAQPNPGWVQPEGKISANDDAIKAARQKIIDKEKANRLANPQDYE